MHDLCVSLIQKSYATLIFCFSNGCEKVRFSETRWLLAFLVLLAISGQSRHFSRACCRLQPGVIGCDVPLGAPGSVSLGGRFCSALLAPCPVSYSVGFLSVLLREQLAGGGGGGGCSHGLQPLGRGLRPVPLELSTGMRHLRLLSHSTAPWPFPSVFKICLLVKKKGRPAMVVIQSKMTETFCRNLSSW